MRRFIKDAALIKGIAAMVFAGQVVLFVIVGSFFGLSAISFSFVWQALAIAVIAAILQFIAFTDAVLRRLKYSLRLVIFALPLFAVLVGFAVFFQWFPFSLGTWLTFTAIFLFVFGVITAIFELYSRIAGRKYTERLDAYNRKAQ